MTDLCSVQDDDTKVTLAVKSCVMCTLEYVIYMLKI